VKRNTTILKRQAAAFFLLATFLFIHLAKTLHTHDRADFSSFTSKEVQVQKGSDCSICDYHFTKDSFHHTSFLDTQRRVYLNCYYNFYQSIITSSIGLSYSDRGPPVTA
jgi:hypothetical protein